MAQFDHEGLVGMDAQAAPPSRLGARYRLAVGRMGRSFRPGSVRLRPIAGRPRPLRASDGASVEVEVEIAFVEAVAVTEREWLAVDPQSRWRSSSMVSSTRYPRSDRKSTRLNSSHRC